MTESPRAAFVHRLCGGLAYLGVGNGDEKQNRECSSEYTHRDVKHGIDVHHGSLRGHRPDEGSYEHRGERPGKRVERSANQIQLIASVTAAT